MWTTTRGVLLVYQLKNGRTLERWYSVRGNSETAQDPESDLRRFYALRNAQEAILERCSLPFELTAERIQWANLQIYNPEELRPGTDTLLDSITLSREEMVDFWENGILPDAAEGHIARERLVVGDADWDYTNTEVYLMAVEDPQRFERMGGNSEAMYHRVFRIASDSVHSLDWIEAHTGVRPVVMEDNSLVIGGVG